MVKNTKKPVKLSDETKRIIVEEYNDISKSYSYPDLARKYNVSEKTIYRTVKSFENGQQGGSKKSKFDKLINQVNSETPGAIINSSTRESNLSANNESSEKSDIYHSDSIGNMEQYNRPLIGEEKKYIIDSETGKTKKIKIVNAFERYKLPNRKN